MTEVEKLRALLAEARAITQDSLNSNTTGFEDVNEVCVCDSCERYRSIIQRIDAALAEPVEDDFRRGAEAMREAAVDVATVNARYWDESSKAEGGVTEMEDRAKEARYIAADLRALPVPEDKP